MELFQNRVGNGAAHAAADDADLFLALGLGGFAQGAHKVLEAVALAQVGELFRGGAHRLDNDGDGAFFRVIGVDGNGDPLALFVHPEDDELSRLGLLGDQRSLDLIQGDGGAKGFFSNNFVHSASFLPNLGRNVDAGVLPLTHCL